MKTSKYKNLLEKNRIVSTNTNTTNKQQQQQQKIEQLKLTTKIHLICIYWRFSKHKRATKCCKIKYNRQQPQQIQKQQQLQNNK